MAQTNLCRLCVNPCSGPKSLYGANGVPNWVYQVVAKYFQSVLSNTEDTKGTQLSDICSKCWRNIVDFHTFEQSSAAAQANLVSAPENVCRLCVRSYDGDQYKPLFNNCDNEVYRITFKYMHSMISNPDGQKGQNLGAICLKCWDHLQKFHKFQTDVYAFQKMLPKHETEMEHKIVLQTVKQICTSQTTEGHVSRNAKCHATGSEFEIFNNAVQVKSEPLDLWNCYSLNQSKLLANEMSYNDPLADVKSELDSAPDQMSAEYIPNGFKDDSFYQDSISLPKLEVMDVHSEDDSSEENRSDEYKEADGQLNSKKCKAQIKWSIKTVPKYLDNIIAQWMPSLECVICFGSFTGFTFLLNHFQRQHPKCEFYILCCQCKLVTHQSIVEHGKIHLDSKECTSIISGKPLNSSTSGNAHDNHETNEKTATDCTSAKSHRELNTSLAQWRTVLDNDVHVKSEPIDLLGNETMHQSKLLENDSSRNKTPDQLKLVDHDKLVCGTSEIDYIKYQNGTEEIPSGLKCGSYYQDSISLPKLDITDVPSETNYNQVNLSDKISDEKKGTYTCNVCGKSFNILNSYNVHNRRKHSNSAQPAKSYKEFDAFVAQWRTSLKCELCGASAAGFTELKQHFRREHPQVKCFITCCERKLTYRYQVSEHIIIHINPNTYKCEMCYKCYNSRYSLRRHEKLAHFSTKDTKSIQDEAKGNNQILNEDD